MRRKYLHRIDVYKNIPTLDGFGGNNSTPVGLGNSWANIETLSTTKLNLAGLDINKETVRISMRYRDDIEYRDEQVYFVYKEMVFQPLGVANVDIFNRKVEVNAVNIKIDTMPQISYIPVTAGSGLLFEDGFTVTKISPNVADTMEVGDFVHGHLDGQWVAGFIVSLPITTTADLNLADQGEPI